MPPVRTGEIFTGTPVCLRFDHLAAPEIERFVLAPAGPQNNTSPRLAWDGATLRPALY